MLRVIIDTSSLVSTVLTRGELMRRVVAHWRSGTFTVLSSPATRAELAVVLARPSIRELAAAPLDELVRGLERFSEHVPGALDLAGACRAPKDGKFLACAVEGGAHYLVSSDRDLLELRHCRGVAIVNPGQFLLALELVPKTHWAACQSWPHYMPVTARCTNANTAITRNRMIAEMVHPRPAFLATPSIPPVPAKNKTT